jgi:two-component system sensor histidine kinase MtrB
VVVTVAGDRDAVAVTVRDRGVGLTLAEQQQVFDRFWRADPARTRKTGGTGLGLAIAMEDTRLHGGWLQAWGERGKGSVFRLTVPRGCGQELAGSPLPLGPDEAEPEAVLSLAGDDALPAAGHPGVPGAAGAAAGVVRIGRVNGLGAAGQAAQPAPKATAGPAPGPGADAHG